MSKKSNTKQVDFKETLWKSADKLRNQMDAAEYKHIVLGLIFLKYISFIYSEVVINTRSGKCNFLHNSSSFFSTLQSKNL